jgi:ferredoxin
MAYKIIDTCNNCRACEPECPNGAITEGPDIFVIDPEKCTECVAFNAAPACATICPVDSCITDDGHVESEAELLVKVKKFHPTKTIPENYPSHFKN